MKMDGFTDFESNIAKIVVEKLYKEKECNKGDLIKGVSKTAKREHNAGSRKVEDVVIKMVAGGVIEIKEVPPNKKIYKLTEKGLKMWKI